MRPFFFFLLWFFVAASPFDAIGTPPPQQPSWRVDALWEAMQDPCLGTQRAAVQYLNGKSVSDSRIAIKLNSLLQDPKWKQDRGSVLGAINSTGVNQILCANTVFGLLEDEDKTIRFQAIDALGRMPLDTNQVIQLIAKLMDPDTYVRQHTVIALTNLAGDKFLKEIARAAVANTDVAFQLAGMDAIASAGTNGIVCSSEIVRIFKSADPSVRMKAVETLGKLQTISNEDINAIISLLDDEDGHVRYKSVEALGRLSEVTTNGSLALKKTFDNQEENWDTRLLAMSVFSRGPAGENFVNENMAGLGDSNAITREDALIVLQQTGRAGSKVASAVLHLLKDTNHLVRQHAIDTLFAFDDQGTDYASDIATLLDDSDKGVRTEALTILKKMNGVGEAAKKKLLEIMSNENYPTRDQILELLASGPKTVETAKTVSRYLSDSDPLVRSKAMGILAGMGNNADVYVSQIANLLKDPVESVRSGSIVTISQMVARGVPCPWKVEDLIKDPEPRLRLIGIAAINQTKNTNDAPKLVALLNDPDQRVGFSAATTLCEFVNKFAPEIAAWILDDRRGGAPIDMFLPNLQNLNFQCPKEILMASFEMVHAGTKRDEGRNRLWGYLTCGVTPDFSARRRWLGYRSEEERPKDVSPDTIKKDMVIIRSDLPVFKNYPETHKEAAEVLAYFARKANWHLTDVSSLESLANDLRGSGFPSQASEVEGIISKVRFYSKLRTWGLRFLVGLLAQCVGWLLLLFFYPRNRFVQAFFFWNKTGRNLFGLGYVGFFIRHIRWTRHRLFVPFQEALVPRGLLRGVDSISYFEEQEIVEEMRGKRRGQPHALTEFILNVRGQIVLEGASGLGKTLLLQKRALQSKEIVVLLKATECKEGVLAAIQHRLQGQVRDEAYLRTLIHTGAMELLVDGLNEASPDTRSKISHFLEENFKGNFILTTQRLSGWTPPTTAKIYELQPLRQEQIRTFLLKQWDVVKPIADVARITREHYEKDVCGLIRLIKNSGEPHTAPDEGLNILRNPMEGCLAAELLAKGEMPNVFQLVEQSYNAMARDFIDKNHREFPLKFFAEQVYNWRKSDEQDIDMKKFALEAIELADRRLMIQRSDLVPTETGQEERTRWSFRHDRIMEFFLLPAFSGNDKKERRFSSVGDERFWGVYDLLATELNKQDEEELYRYLNNRAAETNENELRNRYEFSRRRRKD